MLSTMTSIGRVLFRGHISSGCQSHPAVQLAASATRCAAAVVLAMASVFFIVGTHRPQASHDPRQVTTLAIGCRNGTQQTTTQRTGGGT